MTKEEFIVSTASYVSQWMASREVQDLTDSMIEFFESNVCIPKGENVIIQKQLNVDEWCDAGMFAKDSTYRIKPSEPIYEYFVVDDKGITDWMTIQEFESDNDFKFIAEKTKRIRK